MKIKLIKALVIIGIITLASCSKEKMKPLESSSAQTYPEEITLDNWEQFVHAPQSVIDYHNKKEQETIAKSNNVNRGSKVSKGFSSPLCGKVQAFDGVWRGIRYVDVTHSSGLSTTNIWGNYCIPSNSTGPLCMNYSTYAKNGVSTLDLVLVQRHILGLQPFTEARQFIAADVDGNNTIDTSDILTIRQLVLGVILSFPNVDNVMFIPDNDYLVAQSQIAPLGSISSNYYNFPSCIGLVTQHLNRRAIKKGDVNGNFSF